MSAPLASTKYEIVMQGKLKDVKVKAVKLALNQISESGISVPKAIELLERVAKRYSEVITALKAKNWTRNIKQKEI